MRNLFLLAFATIFLLAGCKVSRKTPTVTPPTEQKQEADSVVTIKVQDSVYIEASRYIKDTVTIIGVGDIMMGTNYPSEDYLPENNGRDLLTGVSDILRDADITFGNLEGVVLNEGGSPKECKNPKACFLFRMPEVLVANLQESGFDVLSVANNHSGDFGEEGRNSTVRVLDSLGFSWAGFEQKHFSLARIKGLIYGFAAFAPNKGTVSIHDMEQARSIVNTLDSLSDIVIISFHGGAEGKDHQNVTRKREFYFGEDRGNVYEFAHDLIDAGADIVFGHGPHVTRALDVYKGRLICYSLGNFCTFGRFNLRGPNGIAPILKVTTNSEGKFIRGKIYPVVQKGRGVPEIDPDGEVIDVIRNLTGNDFPELSISIDESGLITYIEN